MKLRKGDRRSARRCILVVDDNPDGREMLAEYLRFRGFDVLTASDGAEAIDVATAAPPAVILMDLTMPGVDGWEATTRLKADPRTQDCIIVAVTAHALTTDEAKARRAGADAFVAKPYDLTVLGDALAKLLADGRAALSSLSAGQPSQNRKRTSRTAPASGTALPASLTRFDGS